MQQLIGATNAMFRCRLGCGLGYHNGIGLLRRHFRRAMKLQYAMRLVSSRRFLAVLYVYGPKALIRGKTKFTQVAGSYGLAPDYCRV